MNFVWTMTISDRLRTFDAQLQTVTNKSPPRALISRSADAASPPMRRLNRSDSRHGYYVRRLQDLAAQGLVVMISVRMERWRCRNPQMRAADVCTLPAAGSGT
jgi:transposase